MTSRFKTNRGGLAPQPPENDVPATGPCGLAGPAGLIDRTAAPPFDAARYWSYLAEIEAGDAEKAALLEALWSIMARFVEIGFGIDPVQTVIPALIRAGMEGESGEASAAHSFRSAAGPYNTNPNNTDKENDDDQ